MLPIQGPREGPSILRFWRPERQICRMAAWFEGVSTSEKWPHPGDANILILIVQSIYTFTVKLLHEGVKNRRLNVLKCSAELAPMCTVFL